MDKFGEQRESGEQGERAPPTVKAPYSKPVLETYGPVAALTRGGGFSFVDGIMTTKHSDVRAKQDIAKVGTHRLGIGVYAYRYRPELRDRCGHGMQFGVMAHEVESVMPSAVSVGDDGFKRVDYRILAGAQG